MQVEYLLLDSNSEALTRLRLCKNKNNNRTKCADPHTGGFLFLICSMAVVDYSSGRPQVLLLTGQSKCREYATRNMKARRWHYCKQIISSEGECSSSCNNTSGLEDVR